MKSFKSFGIFDELNFSNSFSGDMEGLFSGEFAGINIFDFVSSKKLKEIEKKHSIAENE